MSTCEKSMRKDVQNYPSFSSTLLDQIYRSIDESDKPTLYKETVLKKKQSNVSDRGIEKDDDVSRLRRARLVEQWMERKVREKMVSRRQHFSAEFDRRALYENDPLFFSSSSCSSDSSSGGFSSSGSEKICRSKAKVASCFAPMKLQKIRTAVSQKSAKTEETGDALFSIEKKSEEDGIFKSKLRALKKMKQPISPGGRISSFLNSIFASKNTKNSTFRNTGMDKTPKSTTCSSASSFSRSCLSKNLEKMSEGDKRPVNFYPVSATMDEVRVHKSIHQENSFSIQRKTVSSPTIRKEEELKLQFLEKVRREEENAGDILKQHCCVKNEWKNNGDLCADLEDYDDDDAVSDSSSDLFELDHLAFNCEELPVYETTAYVPTNRAIC